MQDMLRGLRLSMPQGRIRSRQTPEQHRAALITASAKVLISWQAERTARSGRRTVWGRFPVWALTDYVISWPGVYKTCHLVTLQVSFHILSSVFLCDFETGNETQNDSNCVRSCFLYRRCKRHAVKHTNKINERPKHTWFELKWCSGSLS